MKGKAFSPPVVTERARVPPSDAVAPIVTLRTSPGHLSMGTSIGISLFSLIDVESYK
jgi:hypothetical protein